MLIADGEPYLATGLQHDSFWANAGVFHSFKEIVEQFSIYLGKGVCIRPQQSWIFWLSLNVCIEQSVIATQRSVI